MNKLTLLSILLIVLAFSTQQLAARNFRSMIKIPVAPKSDIVDPNIQVLKNNTQGFKPVDRQLVEKGIKEILASWNTNELSNYLVDNFQDKRLLLTSINRAVPRETKLRLLAVQGSSTLEQSWLVNKKTSQRQLKNIVIATVELQIEFNDPFNGMVLLPHTSQFYLQIIESE